MECCICNHKKVREINQAIARGTSFPKIQSRYGISDKSLSWHAIHHLNIRRKMRSRDLPEDTSFGITPKVERVSFEDIKQDLERFHDES